MAKTFVCYLHKPGTLAPELRVVACDAPGELPHAIKAQLPNWGPYDMIEVYDDADHPLFRLAQSEAPEQ